MSIILHTEQISKSFPGVQAVNQVSFDLHRGEILALVGENGAGKSTLTQMLGGVQQPDSGQIFLGNVPVSFSSSHDAIEAGISMVFQELSLVGGLSIAENIFANRQPVGRLDNIRWRTLYRETREFLQRFDLDLDPRMQVQRLSMGRQQILEILKAISTSPTVLMLDEPTSSLTEAEIAYLFANIRKLQAQGMSFIYITHKLSEVFELADRVMVMRDGRHVGTRPVPEVTEQDLVSMMVGRQIEDMYGVSQPLGRETEPYFRVEDFSRQNVFQDITFQLHRGEMLGFSGLVGAGRTELARAIFGIDPKDSGQVILEGKPVRISRPQDAIDFGIAYLTEDRKGSGLFLDMSIRENLVAPALERFTHRFGLLDRASINTTTADMVEEYGIATPSVLQKILNLSGGNQQKCLVAMWMGIRPKVIVFDEPTRGVDVGARSDIYHQLREFAAQGAGIVLISSDLPELIGMCDRILVMHEGRITGEVQRRDFSEELIMAYVAGLEQPLLSATRADEQDPRRRLSEDSTDVPGIGEP
jgi:ABC-type sugar transport system ATPase subunit